MTLMQIVLCWLIANELVLIALIERAQLNSCHRPERER